MTRDLYFRVDIAKKYGPNEAILLHEFVRLTQQNKAEGRNFAKDRYWVCVSIKELAAMYPFWSVAQIKRLTKKLCEEGLILVDNFNVDPMDRRNWYSPSNRTKAIYETC